MAEGMQCIPTTCAMHSAHERAIDVHDRRLDTHGQEIDTINDCLTRVITLQESTLEWQKDADKRIGALEAVPADRWNESVKAFITVIVSAIGGAFIAMISNGSFGG